LEPSKTEATKLAHMMVHQMENKVWNKICNAKDISNKLQPQNRQ